MSVSLVDPFEEATRRHLDDLRKDAAAGKRVIGYFCTYTPVELLHGAGFLPVRLMGNPADTTQADLLTPSFICPYMKAPLAAALRGEYDFLTGVAQGYTCDVACGLVNIWQENFPAEIYHTISIPYNDNTGARRFFRSALEELSSELQKIGAEITEESLQDSLELYRKIRESVLALYDKRYAGKSSLSARDFHWVILAGFVTPPESYLEMLEKLHDDLSDADPADETGAAVMVSGSLIDNPSLLKLIEECGGRVVADDLCTGLRNFSPASGDGADALDRIVDRYMSRFPCPARSRAEDRFPLMLDIVKRSNAKGVVFLFQKFCTPHLADYPTLAAGFRNEGVPCVTVEIEEGDRDHGRIRTRLEAFIEMLS